VAAAALRGVPTLLLEQNAVPGFTNRALSRFVGAAAVTFDRTAGYFGRRAFVAGNPVRPEFFGEANDNAAVGPPRILIFGGSQGAHAINVAMVEAASRLAQRGRRLAITHQTGERDLEFVRHAYQREGIDARVEPFLFAMDREVKRADLVVCRAGATTISELTAAGKPSLLIPLPTAADDHQRKNAEVMQAAGAAELLEQQDMTGESLAARIEALVETPVRLAAMSVAARALARPDAARVIVDRALALVKA
jgi:UDP-N-acetylglucosamine--N-acetylmuramyl-(pentapeptide) pyrophosphoryl-undecaprenol N-acetylglucosamine transferase